MKTQPFTNANQFSLHQNHPIRLIKALGWQVECLSGQVWISAYNHLDDIVLNPGQRFVVTNQKLILMEATNQCTCLVRITQTSASNWPRFPMFTKLTRLPHAVSLP